MIISHSHKFIFIKSAKTAGTSIEAALSEHCSGTDVVTPIGDYRVNRDASKGWVHKAMNENGFEQHDHAINIKAKVLPEVWGTYYKFSIARNPWDRVLSLFFWKARKDQALAPKKRFYHYLGVPFDHVRPVKPLFARFVRQGEWETNDRFYIMDGEPCVDEVILYEKLTQGLEAVCKKVGLPPLDLPQLKVGLRSKDHHYSEYYDQETQSIVADRHANDIRLFGYRFERA